MNNPMALPTLSRDAAPLAVGAGGTEELPLAREEVVDVVVASVLAPELVSEAWTLEALARVDETSLEAATVMLESSLGVAELVGEISLVRELAMEAVRVDSVAVALEMRLEASTATDEATELVTELTTAEAELVSLARELAIEEAMLEAAEGAADTSLARELAMDDARLLRAELPVGEGTGTTTVAEPPAEVRTGAEVSTGADELAGADDAAGAELAGGV